MCTKDELEDKLSLDKGTLGINIGSDLINFSKVVVKICMVDFLDDNLEHKK